MRSYTDHDDDITVESVEINGSRVLVVTIDGDKIDEWYQENLDRVVLHIDEEEDDPKFLTVR